MSSDANSLQPTGWQFWIDRGGTFTDIVARAPDGTLHTGKLLSDNPELYEDAAIEGIQRLLRSKAQSSGHSTAIAAVKMGTTVATNALLERKGARTVLAITAGFADALRIGYQNRPQLFARRIVLPDLLYERVVEIDERVTAQGEVLRSVDLDRTRSDLEAAFREGIRSVAIVLMHSYRFQQHEIAVAKLAREIGFTHVSMSHEASPLIKLVGRGDTAVVDAYLSPVLKRYVERVADKLGASTRLLFMQSNGGLADYRSFQGKDAILSGPAGGIVGMARAAEDSGVDRVIGFDMGGTSTDVSHYAGSYERTVESSVGGVRVRTPMMHIHTVAAGGGSICSFDGSRFRVGPESAGANPGPACYRRGGPLTITDCNVLLGRLQSEFFPHVFGPDGNASLDRPAVERLFATLADDVEQSIGMARTPEEMAEGFLRIAVENMANAIKKISIQRGHDVTAYTLVCFGGAGGQHACMVADVLGMKRVLIHRFAGILSAYGIGLAELRVLKQAAVESRLNSSLGPTLQQTLQTLERDAVTEMTSQGVVREAITVLRHLHLKYEGSDTAITVPFTDAAAATQSFAIAHRAQFGFDAPDSPLVVEAVFVEAVGTTDVEQETPGAVTQAKSPPAPLARKRVWFSGNPHDTPVYNREALRPGHAIAGPAIIVESTATTVIELGWRAVVDDRFSLLLERVSPLPRGMAIGTDADPVMLEVFNNLFMSIAEQMGVALQSTARSVNIKERLDFSCALFDQHGALIANAPHMPVHLGSMGESVKVVIEARSHGRDGRGVRPGDVYMLNAPYNGGTHLPDITVVMPVFERDDEDGVRGALFFVAARGHHADIGGLTPGSMPPNSRTVDEEGVLIDNFLLVDQGRFREAETLELLQAGAYPARNPALNIADLKAQVAACARGAEELHRMVQHFGLDVVHAYMQHVQDNAAEAVRRVLDALHDGSFEYEMDDGAVVRVRVTVDRQARRATIDFGGTSPQLPNNFNAPATICRAAVLYVIRTLVDDDIPMNDGCLRPIDLIIPDGSMLKPHYPAAVVAGNVETSQVVIDAIYGALGVLAAAQGTMNNFTFGDGAHQYYETICGGTGAGPDFDGTDAVHTHATNSRLTDPEMLELRFPVLVENFRIRRGSGGAGRHRGGDGVVRRIRFLKAMTAAILSNRRRVPPFGLQGGSPGMVGENAVLRSSGDLEPIQATQTVQMQEGDTFIIATPGGGGFGASATPVRRR